MSRRRARPSSSPPSRSRIVVLSNEPITTSVSIGWTAWPSQVPLSASLSAVGAVAFRTGPAIARAGPSRPATSSSRSTRGSKGVLRRCPPSMVVMTRALPDRRARYPVRASAPPLDEVQQPAEHARPVDPQAVVGELVRQPRAQAADVGGGGLRERARDVQVLRVDEGSGRHRVAAQLLGVIQAGPLVGGEDLGGLAQRRERPVLLEHPREDVLGG